jgi:hypothetical protein
MKTLLATTALVLCTLGTANAVKADRIQLTPQQRIAQAFEALDAPTPVAEIVQATRCPVLRGEPDYDWCNQQAAPVPYLPDVPTFVVHAPATQPDDATTEVSEAAPIGLVGEPYPPGIEQQPGGIGSDYVAQAKADRAVAQASVCPQPTAEDDARLCKPQATTAAIKEDALAAKDAAVLSAHAEAKPKRTRTRKH